MATKGEIQTEADRFGSSVDKKLFAHPTDPNSPDVNLLELLVRHQTGGIGGIPVGGDAMLTRFTTDLDTYSQAKGGAATPLLLSKALIAFAMEKYYTETTADASQQQQLFKAVTAGLQFDTSKIATDITTAKGDGITTTAVRSGEYFDYDANLNGPINTVDTNFTTLKIWKDANGDGVSSADELFTFTAAGVKSIATGHAAENCASFELFERDVA